MNLLLILSLLLTPPAGYYHSCEGLSGDALFHKIDSVCTPIYYLGYGAGEGKTWSGFWFTDRDEDNSLLDMYSNTERFFGTQNSSISDVDIEHCLPKSWWGGIEFGPYYDLFNLYPADGPTNKRKSNHPLGQVVTVEYDNGVSLIGLDKNGVRCFEPSDEYKGDFARTYLYVATIYNDFCTRFSSFMLTGEPTFFTNDALDMLLKWHQSDPVSAKEEARQEAVYAIQHNRNPFIDYPDLVDYLFGNKQDAVFPFPQENRPYLNSPSQYKTIKPAISRTGNSINEKVHIAGGNLTSDLTLSIKNGGATLSHTTLPAANANNGFDIFITLSSTIIDTLVIESADFERVEVPIESNFTDQFLVTKAQATGATSALIGFTSDNQRSYRVCLYKELKTAPDLLISGYIEGSGNNKAIAITNLTGADVDLSYYSLRKQTNGNSSFGSNTPLSGTLTNNSTILIAHSMASSEIKAAASLIVDNDQHNALNFNGNDAIALCHSGVIIDMVGIKDSNEMWGENVTLKRIGTNTPHLDFDLTEWEKYNTDSYTEVLTYNISNNYTDILFAEKTTDGLEITFDNLHPNTRYTAVVYSNDKRTVNGLTFKTLPLNTPEAYDPIKIYSDGFIGSWSKIDGATDYVISLYQTEVGETLSYFEGFDQLTSNGSPLPDGWSGNISSCYTSTGYIGTSAPAAAFKNDNEWIKTSQQNIDVKTLSFVYRFASATADSYLAIEGYNADNEVIWNGTINYADQKVNNASFEIDVEGVRTFKFIYHKAKGNLALDDVKMSGGGNQYTLIDEISCKSNTYTIKDLDCKSDYAYSVCAICNIDGEEFITESSNIIPFVTKDCGEEKVDAVEMSDDGAIVILTHKDSFEIINSGEQELFVQLFTAGGALIESFRTHAGSYRINKNGFMIISITTKEKQYRYKVL